MGALEQFMDYLCPWLGKKVQIRVIYNCSNTRVCQINSYPAFHECPLSDRCNGYQSRDCDCLLFHFYENDNKPGK
jgi:hypothetical protein